MSVASLRAVFSVLPITRRSALAPSPRRALPWAAGWLAACCGLACSAGEGASADPFGPVGASPGGAVGVAGTGGSSPGGVSGAGGATLGGTPVGSSGSEGLPPVGGIAGQGAGARQHLLRRADRRRHRRA